MATREISNEAMAALKHFEGLSLVAYRDPVGIWTIGYGHTKTVKPGQKIDEREAENLLRFDLLESESCVERRVNVPMTSGHFDALVLFVFNVGCHAFGNSTMLRKLNAGDYDGAHDEFPRWKHAKGKVLPGLVRRRAAEQVLFRREETEEEA